MIQEALTEKVSHVEMTIPKFTLIIDKSGSMAGTRWKQVCEAVKHIQEHC
jgi:hypothetical protein